MTGLDKGPGRSKGFRASINLTTYNTMSSLPFAQKPNLPGKFPERQDKRDEAEDITENTGNIKTEETGNLMNTGTINKLGNLEKQLYYLQQQLLGDSLINDKLDSIEAEITSIIRRISLFKLCEPVALAAEPSNSLLPSDSKTLNAILISNIQSLTGSTVSVQQKRQFLISIKSYVSAVDVSNSLLASIILNKLGEEWKLRFNSHFSNLATFSFKSFSDWLVPSEDYKRDSIEARAQLASAKQETWGVEIYWDRMMAIASRINKDDFDEEEFMRCLLLGLMDPLKAACGLAVSSKRDYKGESFCLADFREVLLSVERFHNPPAPRIKVNKVNVKASSAKPSWMVDVDWSKVPFTDTVREFDGKKLTDDEKRSYKKSGICFYCRETLVHKPNCRCLNIVLTRSENHSFSRQSSLPTQSGSSLPASNEQIASNPQEDAGGSQSAVDGSTPPTNVYSIYSNSPSNGIVCTNLSLENIKISTVSTRSSGVPLVLGLDSSLDGEYWTTISSTSHSSNLDPVIEPTTNVSSNLEPVIESTANVSSNLESAIQTTFKSPSVESQNSDIIETLQNLTKFPVPEPEPVADPIDDLRFLSKHSTVSIPPVPAGVSASNEQIASNPPDDAPGIYCLVDGSNPQSYDVNHNSLNSPSLGIKSTLDSGEEEDDFNYFNVMQATSSQRFTVNLFANGIAASGLLDTGSLAMVMNPDFATRLGLTPHSGKSLNLVFADGRSTSANQYVTATISCGRYKRQWDFILLEIEEDIIIGTPFFESIIIRHLDIKSQNFQFHSRQNPQRLIKWFGEAHETFSSNIPIRVCSINELSDKDEISRIHIFAINNDNSVHPDFEDLVQNSHPCVAEVLKKFPDRFPKNPTPVNDLPRRPEDMKINIIPGAKIPPSKLIRRSEKEQIALKQFIQESLENGRIAAAPAHTADSIEPAQALLIRKPDGSLRVCIDWRFLNSATVKDKTPLPPYQEIWENVRGKKFLGKMDIRDAFYNIRIDSEHQHKTSFKTRDGLFYFTVCPMGLTNSPATFMRLMNRIFSDMNDVFLNYYMDDLMFYSDSIEEHARHIEKILERLREHSLVLKPTKCLFGVGEMDFCGMTINSEGINIQESQKDVMRRYPQIKSRKQLQSFLGSVRFLAEFIPGLAEIAFELFELTSKTSPWSWNVNNQMAVRTLQYHMSEASSLKYFDSNLETFLHTDASDFAIGGWIGQVHLVDGKPIEYPVCYWSRKLTIAERKCPTHDKELLAMFSMIVKFRMYLFGVKFTVLVDHRSLENLQNQQHLNPKQIRIVEYLQAFDFLVKYIHGPSNIFADWLSRIYDISTDSCPHCHKSLDVSSESDEFVSISAISTSINIDSHLLEIKHQQSTDLFCLELNKWAANKKDIPRSKVGFSKSFSLINDIWYYRGKALVIPDGEFRLKYLELFHGKIQHGHFGFLKTRELMGRSVYWNSLDQDLHSFIQSCDLCQRSKACRSGSSGLLHPLPIADSRGKSVSVDFASMPTSKDGYDYLMVIVDRFSKLTVAIPTSVNLTAEQCAKLFWKHWVLRGYGTPDSLVSDRDSLFVGKFWKQFCDLCGIDQMMSTARHQQTDGLSEIGIRVIKESLRRVCNHQQDDWDILLDDVLFSINNSVHSSTGFTPLFLMHAFEPITLPKFRDSGPQYLSEAFAKHSTAVEDTHLSLSKAQTRQSNAYNKQHHDNSKLKVGDLVLLDRNGIELSATQSISKKLLNPWIGPFEVIEFDDEKDNATLRLPFSMKVHNIFHIRCLRKYIPPNTDFPTRFTLCKRE